MKKLTSYLIAFALLAGAEHAAQAKVVVHNTNSLIAALAACDPDDTNSETSCSIEMMEGEYKINNSITLNEGTTLYGTNKDTVVITTDNTINMIVMKSYTTIRNLTIIGDGSTQETPAGSGILIHGSSSSARHDCLVENVSVENNNGQGISLQYAYNNKVVNVDLINNRHRGINISAKSHDNIVKGVIGSGNRFADILIGHGSHHNVVSDGILKEMTGSHPNLWIHSGSYNNAVSNIVIQASSANRNAKGGLTIKNSRYNTISNVHITGFATAIRLYASTLNTPYPNIGNDDTRDNFFTNCIIDNRSTKGAIAIELEANAPSCTYTYCNPNDRRRVRGTVFSNIVVNYFDKVWQEINDPSRVLETGFSNTIIRNITYPQTLPIFPQ